MILILGVIASLMLPSLGRVLEASRRTQCRSNLRQLGIAAALYSDESRDGAFSGTLDDRDDDQNWVYPDYAAALGVFRCPSTRNRIRSDRFVRMEQDGRLGLEDLTHYAGDRLGHGSSYEVYGFMNFVEEGTIDEGRDLEPRGDEASTQNGGVRKTIGTVQSYVHENEAFGLRGTSPGPSQILLFLDGDWMSGNYPTERSNHRAGGLNVQFCDGHVEWISAVKWPLVYELSQDENRTLP